MVGERQLRAHELAQLAHGGDVGSQVARELRIGAAQERARLDALVAIGHVHRQQPADVGPVHAAATGPLRRAHLAHAQGPAVPVSDGVHERLLLGVAVLAEQVHVVAQAHERFGQARVVYVGPGALEQVAVEDQDAHRAQRTHGPGPSGRVGQ